MTTLNPGDLTELERVGLGVLGAGLVPSSVAHDPSFRLDHLTAVSLALVRGLPAESYLDADGRASQDFQRDLTRAYYALDAKRILGVGGPPAEVFLSPESQTVSRLNREPLANFEQYPTVFDRYLAGRCLDDLLRNAEAYRFIMGKYAESSEIWQRVYQQYI